MSQSPDVLPIARVARFAVAERRIRELTRSEFQRLTELIYQEAGITLPETKRALVVRRLSGRIAELGLTSFGEYYDAVRSDASGAEVVRMIDLIATNETHFFREPAHFDLLEKRVFPSWRSDADAGTRPRRIRAWSAACSTGQEPYSLAMQLLAYFPRAEGWQVDLFATDISTHALRIAQAATWPVDRAREIPERYLKRFMQRGIGDWVDRMRATAELREAVHFSRLNLNEETYAVPGEFDLIFCRNVLIYFSAEGRARVIERLTSRLSPTGMLFVGHAESLHAHRERLTAIVPTVYRRVA